MQRGGQTDLHTHTHRQTGKDKTQAKASDLKAMFIQNNTNVALRKKER